MPEILDNYNLGETTTKETQFYFQPERGFIMVGDWISSGLNDVWSGMDFNMKTITLLAVIFIIIISIILIKNMIGV